MLRLWKEEGDVDIGEEADDFDLDEIAMWRLAPSKEEEEETAKDAQQNPDSALPMPGEKEAHEQFMVWHIEQACDASTLKFPSQYY